MKVCGSCAYGHPSSSGNGHQFSFRHPLPLSHCRSQGLDGIPLIARGCTGSKSKPAAATSQVHTANTVNLTCSIDAARRDSTKAFRNRTDSTLSWPHEGDSGASLGEVHYWKESNGIVWATNPSLADVIYLRTFSHLLHNIAFFLS